MAERPAYVDARILVVDDQEANVAVLERLLDEWGYANVISTTDSSEVLDLYAEMRPDLILLDLQMPEPDGYRLLELLRAADSGAYLPIVVLTADITSEAKERALSLGATDFLTKPFDFTEVRLRVGNLLETRRLHLEVTGHAEILERRVRARTRELEQARLEILQRLALAVEYRDDSTYEHPQRVGRTAALLAAQLGQPPDEVELIRRTAPLHDVGKVGISDQILLKPGRLSSDEFELMKTHCVIGAQILSGSGLRLLQMGEQIARTHHERWDGSGYPGGLSGEKIPLPGRLTGLADVFDTLVQRRPYKEAWPIEEAVAEIRLGSGEHFDPALVEAFDALDHEALLTPVGDDDMSPLPA